MKNSIANIISALRILLIFPVLWAIRAWHLGDDAYRLLALVLFLGATALDVVDGWVARNIGQVTQLGRILDPLADRFLMVLTIIFLTDWGRGSELILIPALYSILHIVRDILVGGGYLLIRIVGKAPLQVSPTLVGRVSAILQFGLILLVYLQVPENILNPFLLLSGVFVVCSGLQYGIDGYLQYRKHHQGLRECQKN